MRWAEWREEDEKASKVEKDRKEAGKQVSEQGKRKGDKEARQI